MQQVGELIIFLVILVTCANCLRENNECSGNGRTYADSPGHCECYACYSGLDCAQLANPCMVPAMVGDPALFEHFWEKTSGLNFTASIPPNYRMGYSADGVFPPGKTTLSGLGQALNSAIRTLHMVIGNAETDGYTIVIGSGCTQLLNAASYALTVTSSIKVSAFAKIPYFYHYRQWAEFGVGGLSWNDSLVQNPNNVIEFVTHPNNPNGIYREPQYPTSPNLIYDMVYYWPQYVDITQKLNKPIMLFSISKLTGNAGSRFGWALVKDSKLAATMQSFIAMNQLTVGIDTQFRALRLLQSLLNGNGFQLSSMMSFVRSKMDNRWSQIVKLFQRQRDPARFEFVGQPHGLFVWIHCKDQTVPCDHQLQKGNVAGASGSSFGATDDFMRIEIAMRDEVFSLLINNLQQFLD